MRMDKRTVLGAENALYMRELILVEGEASLVYSLDLDQSYIIL